MGVSKKHTNHASKMFGGKGGNAPVKGATGNQNTSPGKTPTGPRSV